VTPPISKENLIGGGGLGTAMIAILMIFMNPGVGDTNQGFTDLDKRFEVHAAGPGHYSTLQNIQELKEDITLLQLDFKEDFKLLNEKLDKNYRILCQISEGNCN